MCAYVYETDSLFYTVLRTWSSFIKIAHHFCNVTDTSGTLLICVSGWVYYMKALTLCYLNELNINRFMYRFKLLSSTSSYTPVD